VPISLRSLCSVCSSTGTYGSSLGGSVVESGLPPELRLPLLPGVTSHMDEFVRRT
jgi:hypothetical protein